MIASQHNDMATASLSEFARILGPSGTLFLISLTPPEKMLPFLTPGPVPESVSALAAGDAENGDAAATVAAPSSWNLLVNEQRAKVHGGAGAGGEQKGEGDADRCTADEKVVDYWLFVATPNV